MADKPLDTESTAYELAQKQRAISIAEFFEKNRHLLGFDNKRKALLTAVKEAVDNSVECNEPVLIRKNGEVQIVKIGEFIDRVIERNNPSVKDGVEFAKIDGYEVLVYDDKNFKMSFKPASKVHRHVLRDKLFEIETVGGRKVKVTGSHSVFALKNSKVSAFPVKELQEGDHIVVPRARLISGGSLTKLDLTEELQKLSSKIRHKIMMHGVSFQFDDIPRDWKRFDYTPYSYFEGKKIPENALISVRNGRSKIPVIIEITPELMRLLGYYAAEGTCYDKWITFSFGSHEKELIEDTEKCLISVFGNKISFSRIFAHKTAITVKVYAEVLVILFKYIFGTGSKAFNKTVPNLVFNVPTNLQMEFLKAYTAGDGYFGHGKITLATVSEELSTGIQYLLALNGIAYSVRTTEMREREFPSGYKSLCREVHYIYIYGPSSLQTSPLQNNSPLSRIPLAESGFRNILQQLNPVISYNNPHYRLYKSYDNFTFESAAKDVIEAQKYSRSVITLQLQEDIQYFESLLDGDIGFLKIKSIREVKSDKPYVYDFSVPGFEKFLGGRGPIFLHNSLDACEEARVLPEVVISLTELSEDRFQLVVEDNGPGIVKNQIPQVFARLLYGSKFHTLAQRRGQQGLGISAAILYAQLTTGKPATITSRISPKKPAHHYELRIDVQKNAPEILKEEEVSWQKAHGTKIEIEVEATYQKGFQSVDEYIKQTAIVNPHATIIYTTPKAEQVIYSRATDKLPELPREIKPHPYGVEIGLMIRMLASTTSRTLQSFLMNEFSRVGSETAKEICRNAALLPGQKPSQLTREQVEKLIEGVKNTRIIAPPTDCISPIGEELIEKGLKKEIAAEFYCSTTRPPSVYRGNPFQIECCTGDTELLLENGKIITIREYVESNRTEKVFSMNESLKITPTNVLAVHKFKNAHKILKITTRTGKSLKVTDNNEMPKIENGNVIWLKAANLAIGDHIATPRSININVNTPLILDILKPEYVKVMNNDVVKDVIQILKTKHSSLKNAAELLNINYDNLKSMNRKKHIGRPTLSLFRSMTNLAGLNQQITTRKISKITYVDNNFNNPVPITLPSVCEDLMYTLGLLNSDGYISKSQIAFVNKDETLHHAFKMNINSLFGLEAKRYSPFSSVVSNKTLHAMLKQLELKLPELPTHLITSWLKGYVDGDGYPRVRKGKVTEINIATAKLKEAKLVQSLLLRLGIISTIVLQKPYNVVGFINGREVRTKKIKYNISIGQFESIQKFSNLVSFRQVERASKLANALQNEVNSRGDLIPIGQMLHDLRTEKKIFQNELGFADVTIRQVEKGRQDITRLHLQQIMENQSLSGLTYEKLKTLAFSDILWDMIISIEECLFEEDVYDLTTENGNFLADSIIMHNCGIAYGGQLPQDQPVTILRFANKVPLLYQQGACGTAEAIAETNWKTYGLQQSGNSIPAGPAVILVHIASVWVPFTSEAKEAIAHYPEIIKELKLALQECGRKLSIYVNKKHHAQRQLDRANLFEAYIPEIADSLADIAGVAKTPLLDKLNSTLRKEEIQAQLEVRIPEIEEEMRLPTKHDNNDSEDDEELAPKAANKKKEEQKKLK